MTGSTVLEVHCPSCSHDDTKVIDSRMSEEGSAIRRRRSCPQCAYRFTTYERLEEVPLHVLKRYKLAHVCEEDGFLFLRYTR